MVSDRLNSASSSSSSSSSVQDHRTPWPKVLALTRTRALPPLNPRDRAMILKMVLPRMQARTAEEAAYHPPPPHELARYRYPSMSKALDNNNFKLHVVEGEITDSQIVVVLGKKGTGESTFLHLLAGFLEPDEVEGEIPKFNVSYKPRSILWSKPDLLTVRDILHHNIPDSCMMNPEFVHNVMEPLHVTLLMDKAMKDLSPAQLQRVALCLCLGKPADIYLIDIPSVHLDSKQQFTAAQVIKWFIRHEKKAAFVVERDFRMASQLADRFIVIEGEPFVHCTVNGPVDVLSGAKLYLSQLDDSLRRFPIEFWLDLKKLELEAATNG